MITYKNIDDYISIFPDSTKIILEKIRETIKESAPKATEAISYGMPTFKLNGNLVHFAAYKNHIGFYPSPSPIIYFKKELLKYKCSKGAIQFPINEEIPYKLIKDITEFRVLENSNKK